MFKSSVWEKCASRWQAYSNSYPTSFYQPWTKPGHLWHSSKKACLVDSDNLVVPKKQTLKGVSCYYVLKVKGQQKYFNILKAENGSGTYSWVCDYRVLCSHFPHTTGCGSDELMNYLLVTLTRRMRLSKEQFPPKWGAGWCTVHSAMGYFYLVVCLVWKGP